MPSELPPCPWCNAEPQEYGSNITGIAVFCANQKCPVQPIVEAENRAGAYRKWNTRTPDPQLAALQWTEITPENLPRLGDEVGCFQGDESCVYEVTHHHTLFTAKIWTEQRSMTHRRPINAPEKP